MKRLKVYVDTSVIGGCYDKEFYIWSNGLFEDFKLENFVPIVSELTATEIKNAPELVRLKYEELESISEYLIITDEAIELADIYLKRKILTPKFYDDMLHIALATLSNVDIVVSWNFKHLVHFDKIRLFNAVNLEFGYSTLQIYSPREVTNYGN